MAFFRLLPVEVSHHRDFNSGRGNVGVVHYVSDRQPCHPPLCTQPLPFAVSPWWITLVLFAVCIIFPSCFGLLAKCERERGRGTCPEICSIIPLLSEKSLPSPHHNAF